jgi:molecular chaperone HscB
MTMDPFATLGVARAYDVDLAALEKTHRELSRALHPDRYIGASPSERRAALAKAVEVNEAWRVVRDPIRRAEALLALGGAAVGEGAPAPASDPEFLMDMMERREALSEAKAASDLGAVRRMATAVEERARAVEATLASAFAAAFARGPARVDGAPLADLVVKVAELKFYRRFLEEVSAIEDELAA